jgi:hypothetical protein
VFPPWARWASVAWLAVWIPAYAAYWGWENFLHLCDVAVFLTCLGFACNNALLLSSQAVSSLLGDRLWCIDACWRWIAGRSRTGGTEYMWDARIPLWVRLLSLFHVVLPVMLLMALRRTGYDRRALPLQCAIAAGLLVASRFLGAAQNVNYAFADPIFHRAYGAAPLHLAVIFGALAVIIYWPTHVLLARAFPAEPPGAGPANSSGASVRA